MDFDLGEDFKKIPPWPSLPLTNSDPIVIFEMDTGKKVAIFKSNIDCIVEQPYGMIIKTKAGGSYQSTGSFTDVIKKLSKV